jgi:hypothetical protein
MTVEADDQPRGVKRAATEDCCEALWVELVRQWWENHCQRCGMVWPHDDLSDCWCKPPAILASVSADDLVYVGKECVSGSDDSFD